MHDQQQQPDDKMTMRGSFNALLFIAQTHAACIWPFLRTGCGVDAPGMYGALAFVLLLFLAGASESFLIYLGFWLVALCRQRIKADRSQHSRYLGFPAVAIRIPGFRTEKKAKAAEPLLCMAVGVALSALDPSLGAFVFCGAFSLAVVEGVSREVWRRETIAMRDAQILMTARAERFRGERHDY